MAGGSSDQRFRQVWTNPDKLAALVKNCENVGIEHTGPCIDEGGKVRRAVAGLSAHPTDRLASINGGFDNT